MFTGTVCRLPTFAQPAICKEESLYEHSLDVGSLFVASSRSANAVGKFYNHACVSSGDTKGDTKLLHTLSSFGQHDTWILPDEDDKGSKDFYYRQSQTDELLRAEARRSASYRKTSADLNDMCMTILEGHKEGMQTNRDLAPTLYETTGLSARLRHLMRISTIDEKRVDALARAFLARRDMTFETWAAMRRHIRTTLESLASLERRNAQISKTAARARGKVASDLYHLSMFRMDNLTEPVATFDLWSLLRNPMRVVRDFAAVTKAEIAGFEKSLEHVQNTARQGQYSMDDIRSLLNGFDEDLRRLERAFDFMKPVTRQALLEDWEQNENRIALKGSAWRQTLIKHYGFKTWASIFFMDDEWQVRDLFVLLEMVFEPILIVVLVLLWNPIPDGGLWYYPQLCLGWFGCFALFVFCLDVLGALAEDSIWDALYPLKLLWAFLPDLLAYLNGDLAE
ncbi:hypothetical protein PG997_010843 [Apiospora hydei]|uniref:Uncharacterized protein n=1 Tax=Apiospora hydei TaxID=1337664 RepID=A0ABR1VK83_9PEZI